VPFQERQLPPAGIRPGPGFGHDSKTVRFVEAEIFSISIDTVLGIGGVKEYQTTDSDE
jgi:hypothetical protein